MNFIENLASLILAVAIIPSFTALSDAIFNLHPDISRYLGPVNFLKIGFPVLAFYVWTKSKQIPKKGHLLIGAFLVLLPLATIPVGRECYWPSALVRESAVMIEGLLAAVCLALLPNRNQRMIATSWVIIILATGLIDAISHKTSFWLYQHIFDPNTLGDDKTEVGGWALTGVFGRQAMSKFLSWTPWVLSYFYLKSERISNRLLLVLSSITILATASTLATTQRGPFLGALCGWGVLALHQWTQLKNYKLVKYTAIALSLCLLCTFAIVPRPILEVRMRSLLGIKGTSYNSDVADANRDFRLRMSTFSLQHIRENPWGNACIPEHHFYQADLMPAHSHSLFLHQFRERGWLWGSVHLLLWLVAFIGAWKSRSLAGSALSAGIACVLISGLVDHPWIGLNQSLILATYLVLGWFQTSNRSQILNTKNSKI